MAIANALAKMPFLAHFNQSKPVVTSLSQICGHFLLVTEFPLAEYPCNLGKLHFATENATDSGRGVFEKKMSLVRPPACHRGHGGVRDRMCDSKQETGGSMCECRKLWTMRQHMLTHRIILIHAMKLAGDATRGQSGVAP